MVTRIIINCNSGWGHYIAFSLKQPGNITHVFNDEFYSALPAVVQYLRKRM